MRSAVLIVSYLLQEESPFWEVTSSEPVKKFPAFNGTWRFITAFTCAFHLSLSWAKSVHSMPPSHFLMIYLIILPSMPGSSKWSHYFSFSHQNQLYTSSVPHTCYMSRLSYSSRIDHPNNVCEEYTSLSSSLCIFFHSPVTSYLLGPNILFSTLFSNTLSLCSSLSMSNQVSHLYKTRGSSLYPD